MTDIGTNWAKACDESAPDRRLDVKFDGHRSRSTGRSAFAAGRTAVATAV